ncbi:hypothetical protein ES703_54481 [subsurface metagenome]
MVTKPTITRRILPYWAPKEGNYAIALQAQKEPVYGRLGIRTDNQQQWLNLDTFREIEPTIVANDNQTALWEVAEPDYVTLSDDTDVKIRQDSQNSLKVNLRLPGRSAYTFLERIYQPMEDWSQDLYLVFWFKGEGSDAGFQFSILFNDSYEDSAVFGWYDESKEWRRLVLPLAQPGGANGKVDWSKVWKIRLSTGKDTTGTFYLDHLSRYHNKEWINLAQSVHLPAGENSFTLNLEGKTEVNQLLIYPLNEGEGTIPIGNLFQVDDTQTASISYEKLSPTKYIVHISTSRPFWLTLSEVYNPLWKAIVAGEEIDSVPSYSFVNSFFLTKTGDYDVTIEFMGQRYVHYGGIISLIAFLGAIVGVILERKRERERERGSHRSQ